MRPMAPVVLSLSLAMCGLLVSSSANAVTLSSCTSATGLPCAAVKGDVLADGVVVPNSGNDFENIVEAAIKIATGSAVDITKYGKSDENPGLFTFSNFDVGTDLTSSFSGNWSVIDGTLIAYITVKAANSFALIAVNPLASSGTYSSMGLFNNSGQQPEVSHITFWTVSGNQIPEPASLLLMISGLVGTGLARRKLS